MDSRVLLVDDDVDALAPLAAVLRQRGIHVSLASGVQMACDRARSSGYDVILATRRVTEPADGSIGVSDALSVELAFAPPFLLLVEGSDGHHQTRNEHRVDRDDIESIVRSITQLTKPREHGSLRSLAPSTHTFEGAPLGDLLTALVAERRSGTLTVTTSEGPGEVRLVEGEVADVVYVRLEGKKALARMLEAREGSATFAPGAPAIMRRIHEPTRSLVAEAKALAEKAARLREAARDLATSTLLWIDGPGVDLISDLDRQVLARLRVPATLGEVLDDLPDDDPSILESLLRLDAAGRLRRLGHSSSRVQICGADQLHQLRASAARALRPGFAGPARLVFAATPARLGVFGHTVLLLADVFPAREPVPAIPLPHVLATIRLGDGVELDVVALPLVPVYAPLWPMALAGAVSVVRLDEAAPQQLAEACDVVGVAILDAKAIVGSLEESNAVAIASLIKTALNADL